MSNGSACRYPSHHAGSKGGAGLAAVVVAVLVVIKFRHLIIEAFIWAGVIAGVVLAVVVLVAVLRRRPWIGLPADLGWVRHAPRAAWAACRWRALARRLALAVPDKHASGRVLRPRAVVHPSRHGVTARVRTVPGSGRKEFDKDAEHIANAWRVQRVSVSQPRPGRLVVRGLRRDPLLEKFGREDHLARRGEDHLALRHLYLGRDEHGQDRYVDLANVPGICVGGMPGAGKSTEITSWLTQMAPSPAVQFALADGKNAGEFDDFADRAYVMAGDDLDEVIDLLEKQHGLMTDRLACVRKVLGSKNAWHKGPTEAWPLAVTVLDECQSCLDLTAVKGDKALEAKVRRCIFLTSSLIRRGRSVMMLTVPATQKPTTDSVPSAIRDNCPIAMSFAVRTTDAAAATLGSSIRDYPTYSPAGLALPDYTGVATVTLRTGQDPFTRLRGPWVDEDQAAGVASASAHLRRDPRASLPVVVPDDASALVGS